MKTKALSLLLALALVTIAACGTRQENGNAIQSAAEASSVYTVSSYITVNSVNEMIQKSSTIVIGKVTKIADHRNLARVLQVGEVE